MDPYHPPETEIKNGSRLIICREIVIWWEKRRLVYNGIMLVVGMTVLLISGAGSQSQLLTEAVAFGLGANVCYFAGPLVELYYSAIARRRNSLFAEFLFWGGLFLSLILAVVIGLALSFEVALPNQA